MDKKVKVFIDIRSEDSKILDTVEMTIVSDNLKEVETLYNIDGKQEIINAVIEQLKSKLSCVLNKLVGIDHV